VGRKEHWVKGKTALITGGGKRIGREMALVLASMGTNVVIHYRKSVDEAEYVAEQAKKEGVNAWTIQADLADPNQAMGLLPRTLDLTGPVQILINNASIFDPSQLQDFTAEDLIGNIQVNAMSPLLISRSIANQKLDGAIINFLDTRITEYDRNHAAYHLSKRMFFTMTRMMALEFAPQIRVGGIAPGLILPPPGKDVSYLERLAPNNPLNRIGSLEGITDAVVFLLESQFITGQIIFVDGGYHMKGAVYG
jgi:NAD(P)-dependent dehydrogenase (short-subunit alcohol dehydrogenase family)